MSDEERKALLTELAALVDGLHVSKQLRAWASEENQTAKRRMAEIVKALRS